MTQVIDVLVVIPHPGGHLCSLEENQGLVNTCKVQLFKQEKRRLYWNLGANNMQVHDHTCIIHANKGKPIEL